MTDSAPLKVAFVAVPNENWPLLFTVTVAGLPIEVALPSESRPPLIVMPPEKVLPVPTSATAPALDAPITWRVPDPAITFESVTVPALPGSS